MSKKAFLSLAVILPMCIATAIYILFRNADLVVFSLLEKINLLPLILEWRDFINSFIHPYSWIVFSLPGSLWMLSSMNLLLLIWNFNLQKQNVIWIFSPVVFAVILEMFQAIHWTDGTFDLMDLLFYGFATLLFLAVAVRSFLRQDDKPVKKRNVMHLQSFTYTICLLSVVYCSDKITAPLSHTNPSDISTEVPHTASIHSLSPNYHPSSTH